MSFITGGLGFLVSFFLLRRAGGVGRHILAFVLGTFVSLVLFGVWIAVQLSGGPIGNYRNDVMAATWAFAIAVTVALQIAAMVIAMIIRRRSTTA
jgi:hypothetical protein